MCIKEGKALAVEGMYIAENTFPQRLKAGVDYALFGAPFGSAQVRSGQAFKAVPIQSRPLLRSLCDAFQRGTRGRATATEAGIQGRNYLVV